MINTTEFGKNAVINRVVNNYALSAKMNNIKFNYKIISSPLLSMSDSDLTNMLSQVLNAMLVPTSKGVFLSVNVFSSKMQIECKSFQPKETVFNTEEVEAILSRNGGMLKSKCSNNEFVVQIVFPV